MSNLKQQQIDCLGVVLAGGLSSRMGKDKAMLQHKNSDMLNFSQQLLRDAGIKKVVVSGNQHQVADIVNNLGPVGGIYSVLTQYQPKALLIIPVDLPLMNASALQKLKLAGELSQKACFFENNNIPLYLPNSAYLQLFFERTFHNMPNTDTTVPSQKKSGPSVKAMLKGLPHQSIAIDNPTWLFNSNTPEQWQHAKKQFT